MNQRLDRRSNRTRGSLVKTTGAPPESKTDAKKTSGSASTAPSAVPLLLLKLRKRLFTVTMNCVGPTAPILSGGTAAPSARVAPVKLVLGTCGAFGSVER